MVYYSALHYAAKAKKSEEAIEQIYEEVKKSAQNAIYRNIGDIFFTARTDTEINGAVECNGGTYSTTDFEGKQSVGNLLASGSLPYVSLSEYESLVSANGSCRAFGWDGGTEFRVPTIKALLLNKEQAAVVGNGMTLGLTNGNVESGLRYVLSSYPRFQGAQNTIGLDVGVIEDSSSSVFSADQMIGVTTDPTKSGIVANLDVIEYRAMVQLASGATDQAVITAISAIQQIANKVDKTSATDRETVVGWGMPDYSSIVSTVKDVVNQAPTDGMLICKASDSSASSRPDFYLYFGYSSDAVDIEVARFRQTVSDAWVSSTINVLIPKGMFYKFVGNDSCFVDFCPLKGVK